jgi:hypothetical protein
VLVTRTDERSPIPTNSWIAIPKAADSAEKPSASMNNYSHRGTQGATSAREGIQPNHPMQVSRARHDRCRKKISARWLYRVPGYSRKRLAADFETTINRITEIVSIGLRRPPYSAVQPGGTSQCPRLADAQRVAFSWYQARPPLCDRRFSSRDPANERNSSLDPVSSTCSRLRGYLSPSSLWTGKWPWLFPVAG